MAWGAKINATQLTAITTRSTSIRPRRSTRVRARTAGSMSIFQLRRPTTPWSRDRGVTGKLNMNSPSIGGSLHMGDDRVWRGEPGRRAAHGPLELAGAKVTGKPDIGGAKIGELFMHGGRGCQRGAAERADWRQVRPGRSQGRRQAGHGCDQHRRRSLHARGCRARRSSTTRSTSAASRTSPETTRCSAIPSQPRLWPRRARGSARPGATREGSRAWRWTAPG